MSESDPLRYPIGRPDLTAPLSPALRSRHLESLRAAPAALADSVAGLDDDMLDTPYREGGWTVRQVVHHVADSHLNGYLRSKWILTEDTPALKGYHQDLWAEQPEARTGPVSLSLDLMQNLHSRWIAALPGVEDDRSWGRVGVFPGDRRMELDRLLGLYAWHGEHHRAQIGGLREGRGW